MPGIMPGRGRPNVPYLQRSTLQDPPVLTTAQPIVVTNPGVKAMVAVAIVLMAPQPPAAVVSGPITAPVVVSQPGGHPAGASILGRNTLVDPPVLTTARPVVVTGAVPYPTGTVALTRSSLADVPAGVQPIVFSLRINRPSVRPDGYVGLVRSSLIDAVALTVATPQPIVVTNPGAVPLGAVALYRGTLVDPAAPSGPTTQPIVPTSVSTYPRGVCIISQGANGDVNDLIGRQPIVFSTRINRPQARPEGYVSITQGGQPPVIISGPITQPIVLNPQPLRPYAGVITITVGSPLANGIPAGPYTVVTPLKREPSMTWIPYHNNTTVAAYQDGTGWHLATGLYPLQETLDMTRIENAGQFTVNTLTERAQLLALGCTVTP